MEIERKYLVRYLPETLERYPSTEIEQGYLCTSPTLRIRRAGEQYILTVKERQQSRGVLVNREEEFLLNSDTFAHLRSKCDGRFVSKTRYRIPLNEGLVAELDIFHADHEGLMLVEVEFPSVEASERFAPPEWFGENVSDDPHYSNAFLSQH